MLENNQRHKENIHTRLCRFMTSLNIPARNKLCLSLAVYCPELQRGEVYQGANAFFAIVGIKLVKNGTTEPTLQARALLCDEKRART